MDKITSSGRRSGDAGIEAPPVDDTSDELDIVLPAIGGRRADLEDRYEAGLNDRPKLAMSSPVPLPFFLVEFFSISILAP